MERTTSGRRTGPARGAVLGLLLVLVGMVTSGCLHVNAALTIDGEDAVAGELVITTQTADGKVPFQLTPPEDLADQVRITPYAQGDRVGSHLSFRGLSFDEVTRLSQSLTPDDSRYQFQLSRSGSLVILEASADLTPLANTDSSVEVKVSAPGEITSTNGEESAGTVTWELEPGEVTRLAATFQYASATGGGWVGWAALLTGTTFLVALVVAALALTTHLRARAAEEA
ncbi:DUF3153 domain-containing protein [Saccharopolyspora cebuensis]|uniref:DUF3153 domain-containing protein n=1 Tax=Saccharopolyspora cebuensis TaxID=418759 RepID=A0ABV4CIV0_9PSEU